MKFFILICLLPIISGCIYDPPPKGSQVIVHNQTNQYIFVIDSLPKEGNPRLCDTFLVNKRVLFQMRSNYIPKYSGWMYFFSDNLYQKIKSNPNGKVTLYFIEEKDINKPYDEIIKNRLFRLFSTRPDDIKNHSLNHIFFYGDSILLEHDYNLEHIRR